MMCAHYVLFTEQEIMEMRLIIEEVGRRFGADAISQGDMYPKSVAPILAMEDGRLSPRPVTWGYPKWDGKGVIFNARAETALEKQMFSRPLLTRRCVIPSVGFYEWAHTEGNPKKDKLFFHNKLPDNPMLYMAGMIDTFKLPDGSSQDRFTLLTTAANASMRPFHDRMPVILTSKECESWVMDDRVMRRVLARGGPELVWKKAA
jgi:putative SOS response-associated peptidase YedK